MAERKQFLKNMPVDPDLKSLLDAAKGKQVTREQFLEQRISFAYGNAPASANITKASVRKTAQNALFSSRSKGK
jgi:hypothetical protein